jgi:hypothetical protein
MEEEGEPRRGNGGDQSPNPSNRRVTGKNSDERNAASRRRASPEPSVNAIQATRKPRKNRNASEATAAAAAATDPPGPAERAATAASPAALPRGDSDPWTVPESVRNRFVQDGHRFYFPDGAPAFKDQGRRLTTPSENTQVVHSLIEIAHSRGWTEVTVTGTERFRQEAWREARLAGLNVRGYRPNEVEQAQLIRALARSHAQPAERLDAISADSASEALRPAGAPPPTVSSRPEASQGGSRERIVGKLLDHGRDAYRHDPNEDPSYFVRLQTRDGPREIWGKDIERAVAKSLTQPQVSDEVILQRNGRDAVTLHRRARDSEGQLKEQTVEVYRNRWVIEKREFFEQRATAAQVVRNDAIGPREAVSQHPELAGTYLNLRAAELASRALRDPEDQRRFVSQVRGALADHVERGEPLQPVRLRDRGTPARDKTVTAEGRTGPAR